MNFEQVEKAREAYHEKLRTATIVSLVISAVLTIVIFCGSGSFFLGLFGAAFIFLFVTAIACIITSFTTSKEATAYRDAYKTYFVEQNLRQNFADLHYDRNAGLDHSVVGATGMIDTGDAYHSNDFATGKYKDVAFTQADVHIQERHTDSEGHTTYVTTFRGRMMIFEFPKKFNFKLELIGRRFHAYRIPRGTVKGRELSQIDTESSEFNEMFRIYAEDGFEAFYLLDPATIVKLQTIAEKHKYRILFGFIDNKLLIALNDGKDSFEPPKPNQKINEKEELKKVSEDIKIITDFVDQLSLNRKLFK